MRWLFVALLLAGCAPTLAGGNEAGGQIKNAEYASANRTFAKAQEHCAKYGKVARMTGGDLVFAQVARFECVAK